MSRIPWNKGKVSISHYCKNCGKGICSRDDSKVFCCRECRITHSDKEIQRRLDSGKFIRPGSLRAYLLKKYGHKCFQCQLTHWRGAPVPLNLDHVDGNSQNNSESNLRFLCLNCDGLTSTYGSRNRGNGRWERRKRYAEGKSS